MELKMMKMKNYTFPHSKNFDYKLTNCTGSQLRNVVKNLETRKEIDVEKERILTLTLDNKDTGLVW